MSPVTDFTDYRLRWRVAKARADGMVPSIVAGVVRDGTLAWAGGAGAVPGPLTDTQYKIGSITKTFTAVLILQLVEEGLLSLDAPASSVLGEVGYADRSIRQLSAHSGGLQAEPAGSWWERSEGGSFESLAGANDGSAAPCAPDRQFHYSNLGYGLLGEIVARLRGQTRWEVASERILTPLGMNRTSYQHSGTHAEGWSVHPYAQTLIAEPLPDTAAMAPAGQVWSTVADLATYCGFLLEGHDDVLSPEVLGRAFTPQSGEEHAGLAYTHGLGFQIFRGGSGTLVGHSGSMPGFHAICTVDRTRHAGVVGLVNGTSGVPVAAFGADLWTSSSSGSRPCPSRGRPTRPCRPSSPTCSACGTGGPGRSSSPVRPAISWHDNGASRHGASGSTPVGWSGSAATTRASSSGSYAEATAWSRTSTSARSS
ncbi:beta-lactamase family protein [Nocardioides sp. B-3]|nr:beta-lactamase family protein [Nocardioides sp. B-3]UUZ59058.1 beta-lactamase family protein [Nocardioides sp. B-3]